MQTCPNFCYLIRTEGGFSIDSVDDMKLYSSIRC